MILVKKLPSWAQSPRCSHQFSQREVAALLASATTLQTPPLAPLGMAESSSSRSMALRTVVLLAWAIAFDRARALEAGGGHASFHVDLSAVSLPWSHYYTKGVSAGHIGLASRADYREHLAMVARDIGFEYVRAHGLLDDDVAVSFAPGENSWLNVFSLVDHQLSIGMKPFFEVSYVPSWMSSDNCTKRVMGYSGCCAPPASYAQWSSLLAEFGSALIARYGLAQAKTFRFECWNELDCLNSTEYHQIYQATAVGLKRASGELMVGGPATSCANGWDEPSHPQQGRLFLEFVQNNSVPLDFYSSHIYANKKWTGWAGRASAVVQGVHNATELMESFGIGSLPYYNTEFGSLSSQGDGTVDKEADDIHDTHEQSSFLVAAIDQLAKRALLTNETAFRLPTTLSYWTVSDIMNEVNAETKLGRVSLAPGWPGNNASFHGGLVNAFGVPKPSYRAYQLLHRLGDAQLRVQRTSAPAPQDETATGLGPDELCAITTGVIATTNRSSTGSTRLLLYNHREWDAPQLGHPSPSVTCEITLTFSSNSGSDLPHSATTRTIDAAEANPRAKWIELGMPGYPSPDEHTQILAASELVPRTVPLQQQPTRDDTVRREATLTLTVGKHAVIAVDIDVNV